MRLPLYAACAATAVALFAAAPGHAQTPPVVQPRAVIDRVGKLLEDNYVHPDVAKRLADGLRADAAKGAFDRMTDPRDLATALTDRLKQTDVHFNVAYDPGGSTPGANALRHAPSAAEIKAAENMDRQANWGFRHVDILPGNIGYIDMSSFIDIDQEDPDDPAKKAADAALQLIAGTDAVIVDMRDNGGGSPRMVGYMVSAFVPGGADIYNTFHARGQTFDEKPKSRLAAPPRTTVPLYVLDSARTGSAAEAFGYTLQTAGRARIVGERSGGGANPGGPFPAGDGLTIFISTGEPINPISHRNWEGTGIAPDIAAPWDQALKAAEIDALKTLVNTDAGRDDQAKRWALEALQRSPDLRPGSPLATYAGTYGSRTVAVEDRRLALHRERWPGWVLLPMGGDLFTVEGAPDRRVAFERDNKGRIIAVVQQLVGQPDARHARDAS